MALYPNRAELAGMVNPSAKFTNEVEPIDPQDSSEEFWADIVTKLPEPPETPDAGGGFTWTEEQSTFAQDLYINSQIAAMDWVDQEAKPWYAKGMIGVTLNAIQKPLAITTSLLKESTDFMQGEGFSFTDLKTQIDENYTFGRYINEELSWMEDISIGGWKPVDNIVGFIGDVAFDPLTFLGLVGKGGALAGHIARTGGRTAAASVIRSGSDDLLKRISVFGADEVDNAVKHWANNPSADFVVKSRVDGVNDAVFKLDDTTKTQAEFVREMGAKSRPSQISGKDLRELSGIYGAHGLDRNGLMALDANYGGAWFAAGETVGWEFGLKMPFTGMVGRSIRNRVAKKIGKAPVYEPKSLLKLVSSDTRAGELFIRSPMTGARLAGRKTTTGFHRMTGNAFNGRNGRFKQTIAEGAQKHGIDKVIQAKEGLLAVGRGAAKGRQAEVAATIRASETFRTAKKEGLNETDLYRAIGGDPETLARLSPELAEDIGNLMADLRVIFHEMAGEEFIGLASNYVPRITDPEVLKHLESTGVLGRQPRKFGHSKSGHEQARKYLAPEQYAEALKRHGGDRVKLEEAEGIVDEIFGHKILDPNDIDPRTGQMAGNVEQQINNIFRDLDIDYGMFIEDASIAIGSYIKAMSRRVSEVHAEHLLKETGVFKPKWLYHPKPPTEGVRGAVTKLKRLETQRQVVWKRLTQATTDEVIAGKGQEIALLKARREQLKRDFDAASESVEKAERELAEKTAQIEKLDLSLEDIEREIAKLDDTKVIAAEAERQAISRKLAKISTTNDSADLFRHMHNRVRNIAVTQINVAKKLSFYFDSLDDAYEVMARMSRGEIEDGAITTSKGVYEVSEIEDVVAKIMDEFAEDPLSSWMVLDEYDAFLGTQHVKNPTEAGHNVQGFMSVLEGLNDLMSNAMKTFDTISGHYGVANVGGAAPTPARIQKAAKQVEERINMVGKDSLDELPADLLEDLDVYISSLGSSRVTQVLDSSKGIDKFLADAKAGLETRYKDLEDVVEGSAVGNTKIDIPDGRGGTLEITFSDYVYFKSLKEELETAVHSVMPVHRTSIDDILANGTLIKSSEELGGTFSGGLYRYDNNGKIETVYVKEYPDASQAYAECAANAVYRGMGLDAPASYVSVGVDGKTFHIAPWVDGSTLKEIDDVSDGVISQALASRGKQLEPFEGLHYGVDESLNLRASVEEAINVPKEFIFQGRRAAPAGEAAIRPYTASEIAYILRQAEVEKLEWHELKGFADKDAAGRELAKQGERFEGDTLTFQSLMRHPLEDGTNRPINPYFAELGEQAGTEHRLINTTDIYRDPVTGEPVLAVGKGNEPRFDLEQFPDRVDANGNPLVWDLYFMGQDGSYIFPEHLPFLSSIGQRQTWRSTRKPLGKQLQNGEVADRLVGLEPLENLSDVMVSNAGTRITRIDTGNAFGYGPKRGPKQTRKQVTESGSRANPTRRFHAKAQVQRMIHLRTKHGGWEEFLRREVTGIPEGDIKALANQLEAQSKAMAAEVGVPYPTLKEIEEWTNTIKIQHRTETNLGRTPSLSPTIMGGFDEASITAWPDKLGTNFTSGDVLYTYSFGQGPNGIDEFSETMVKHLNSVGAWELADGSGRTLADLPQFQSGAMHRELRENLLFNRQMTEEIVEALNMGTLTPDDEGFRLLINQFDIDLINPATGETVGLNSAAVMGNSGLGTNYIPTVKAELELEHINQIKVYGAEDPTYVQNQMLVESDDFSLVEAVSRETLEAEDIAPFASYKAETLEGQQYVQQATGTSSASEELVWGGNASNKVHAMNQAWVDMGTRISDDTFELLMMHHGAELKVLEKAYQQTPNMGNFNAVAAQRRMMDTARLAKNLENVQMVTEVLETPADRWLFASWLNENPKITDRDLVGQVRQSDVFGTKQQYELTDEIYPSPYAAEGADPVTFADVSANTGVPVYGTKKGTPAYDSLGPLRATFRSSKVKDYSLSTVFVDEMTSAQRRNLLNEYRLQFDPKSMHADPRKRYELWELGAQHMRAANTGRAVQSQSFLFPNSLDQGWSTALKGERLIRNPTGRTPAKFEDISTMFESPMTQIKQINLGVSPTTKQGSLFYEIVFDEIRTSLRQEGYVGFVWANSFDTKNAAFEVMDRASREGLNDGRVLGATPNIVLTDPLALRPRAGTATADMPLGQLGDEGLIDGLVADVPRIMDEFESTFKELRTGEDPLEDMLRSIKRVNMRNQEEVAKAVNRSKRTLDRAQRRKREIEEFYSGKTRNKKGQKILVEIESQINELEQGLADMMRAREILDNVKANPTTHPAAVTARELGDRGLQDLDAIEEAIHILGHDFFLKEGLTKEFLDGLVHKALYQGDESIDTILARTVDNGKPVPADIKLEDIPNLQDQAELVYEAGFKPIGNSMGPEFMVEVMAAQTKWQATGRAKTFLKYYDRLHNLLKGYQIAKTGFHLRNAYGGFFNNMLYGIDTASYRQFRRALKWYRKEGSDSGRMRIPPEHKAIIEQMDQAGLLAQGAGQVAAEFGGSALSVAGRNIPLKRLRAAVSPLSSQNLLLRSSRKAGTWVEQYLRGALAFDTLKKGRTVDDAFEDVWRYHFDYDDLSDFERGVVKRVIPFYTWTRKVTPLMIEELVKNPSKFQRINNVRNNITDQNDKEPRFVPEWMRELGGFQLPIEQEGENLWMIPDLPIKTPREVLDPWLNIKGLDEMSVSDRINRVTEVLGSQMTPIIKSPLELWGGKQFFHGYEFSGDFQIVPEVFQRVPLLMEALNGFGWSERSRSGEWMMKDHHLHFVASFLPTLGDVRRLFPSEEKYQQRTMSTWMSFMFGLGIRTNTKWEQERAAMAEEWDSRMRDKDMKDLYEN